MAFGSKADTSFLPGITTYYRYIICQQNCWEKSKNPAYAPEEPLELVELLYDRQFSILYQIYLLVYIVHKKNTGIPSLPYGNSSSALYECAVLMQTFDFV